MAKQINKPTTKNPIRDAEEQAEKDILNDPELSDSDPTDDLDEGELARRDNSDEKGFDQLEKKRPAQNHSAKKNQPTSKRKGK